jgi:hypothetical protein
MNTLRIPLWSLVLGLLSLVIGPVQSATVTGTIQPASGTNWLTSVTVHRQASAIIGANYVPKGSYSFRTDTNGFFSISLAQGDYAMQIGLDSLAITVDGSTNAYNFIDLISTNGLYYVYRPPGALVRGSSTDTGWGFLSQKLTNGPAILLTLLTNSTGQVISISLDPAAALQGASLTLTGTNNQITFGAAGDEPAIGTNVVKWVAARVSGDTNAYYFPLFQ